MKCIMCHKEQGRPLELFDGSWACPHCRKEINLPELTITAENNELYAMSELYYFEWLTKGEESKKISSKAAKKDSKKESYLTQGQRYLKLSIDLCRQAAEKGNPLALIRLAYYYDKDYVEVNYTEAMRCKIAYKYYSYVCFYEQPIKTIADFKVIDLSEMKQRAARLMLEMLEFAPKELANNEKYKVEANRKKIIQAGIFNENDLKTQSNIVNEISGAETIMKVIDSCFSKNRAPLFCVLRLCGKELKQIISNKELCNRFIKTAMGGAEIYYIECSGSGEVASESDFIRLSGNTDIKNKIYGLNDDFIYRLVILNGLGKHRFFNFSVRNKIFKYLIGDGYGEPLRVIIDNSRDADCIFYDDDIYIFKDGRSVSNAIDSLIDKLRGAEE